MTEGKSEGGSGVMECLTDSIHGAEYECETKTNIGSRAFIEKIYESIKRGKYETKRNPT